MGKLTESKKIAAVELMETVSWRKLAKQLDVAKSTLSDYLRAVKAQKEEGTFSSVQDQIKIRKADHTPKVLLLDIETAPTKAWVWSLWKQNVGLNQIDADWFILSFAAKWLGAPEEEVIYEDLRGQVSEEDDTPLLESLWSLLNEADIIITQNGKKFDAKKINARLILNGFAPPLSYKHIDTLEIAKNNFAFTSNKLEYMTDKLCDNYTKLKHAKFAGFSLWDECLKDNPEAWQEMEDYNINDVLSLEELYWKLSPWDKRHPNFNIYNDDDLEETCRCGSHNVVPMGYHYTQVSKFQKYKCMDCGAETRGRVNLLTKSKRASLRVSV